MTIHTRSEIYFIVIAITVLVYYFVYRKWLVAPVTAVVSTGVGYALVKLFINWVKVYVYSYGDGSKLKNTEVTMKLSKDVLSSPSSWEGWLSIIVGQVHTSFIFTVGFAAIAIPLMVVLLYRMFLQAPIFEGKAIAEKKTPLADIKTPYLAVTAMVCVLCIGGTIFAQSLTWLYRVSGALMDYPYYSDAYGYKAITYFRYYSTYIGPFFIAALALLYHAAELARRYWAYILSFFVGMQLIFCCFVLPHITNNRNASLNYWPFALWKMDMPDMRAYVYVAGIIASVVGFVVFFVCYLRKRQVLPMVFLLVVLLYEFCYGSVVQDGGYMDTYNSRADATYTLITMLEDNGEEIPHTFYVCDNNPHTQKRIYTEQFLLLDYSLVLSLPDEGLTDAIVFSSVAGREELVDMGYAYAALDDDEYVYVKGDTYTEMLESYGYTFSRIVVTE